MHVTDDGSPFRHIYDGNGDDVLKAVVEDSVMHAFGGDDTVYGSKGSDAIYGNEGNDTIYAGSGNDFVFGGQGDDYINGGNGNDTYVFGRNYGTDIIEDYDGNNKVVLSGIDPNEVTFAKTNQSELTVSINGCEDKLTIRNFNSESFTFEFAGGVSGTVNAETAEFTEIIPEEEIIQSNAKLLSDIYSDESMSSDLLTEISDTVLIDSSSAVSAAKETEETADQTDIQVIILTENMSAFGRSKS